MNNNEIIINRLKECNPELYRIIFEISDSIISLNDYIEELISEILSNNVAKLYKTNEYICLFRDNVEIMNILIFNYCDINNLKTIEKYCHDFLNPNNTNYKSFVQHIAMCIEPHYFTYLNEEITDDINIMEIAIKNNGKALLYASSRIKCGEECLKYLLNKNINCFEFFETDMKNDELSRMAIAIDKKNIDFVNDDVLLDYDFIMYAYKLKCTGIYERLNDELQIDNEIIFSAIDNDDSVEIILIKYKHARNDESTVEYIISKSNNPNILKYVSNEIKQNEDIVTLAIKKNVLAIQHLSNEFKNNYNFMKNLLCTYNYGLRKLMNDIFENNKITSHNCEKCKIIEEKKNDEENTVKNNDIGCPVCMEIMECILKNCKNKLIVSTVQNHFNV